MLTRFHQDITIQALKNHFHPTALEKVIRANLHQDHWLTGLIGHPEYHFDSNQFRAAWKFMAGNFASVLSSLECRDGSSAQMAFGRLIHAGQDFYAHSNYISLWLENFPGEEKPAPDQVNLLDPSILQKASLCSGKIYWLLETFTWLPFWNRFFKSLLPRDSHAWMNLDDPEAGPLFPYAVAAATRWTELEFFRLSKHLSSEQRALFTGGNRQTREV